MPKKTSIVVLFLVALIAGLTSPAAAVPAGPPAITGLQWHDRTGPDAGPMLHFTLDVDAPAGLSSGEVRLGSVFHEYLASVPLEAQAPGAHAIDLELSPPGDKPRPWEVIGLTLNGADGQTTSYGFCDLTKVVETREKVALPRLDTECFDGPGWVVYTFRAGADPHGILWSQGVATHDNTLAGSGTVLEDSTGAIVSWGTSTSVAYPQTHDGTVIKPAGQTVIDQPAPDPSSGPGSHRIVIGVGGNTPASLTPGATYRWGGYFAIRPGHFDMPFISLEGTDIEVLSVERGTSAGIAWGDDFDSPIVVQRGATDTAVVQGGEVDRSFTNSVTCMFIFQGGRMAQNRVGSVGAQRIEGPSAPQTGGVIKAGQPGAYRFEGLAGVGQSWGQFVVGYADMPLTPN
ncbi:MAG: hypothetical protein ABR600_00820 [Actinomycetota bacterium]